jgi:hypothetical protein
LKPPVSNRGLQQSEIEGFRLEGIYGGIGICSLRKQRCGKSNVRANIKNIAAPE